MFERRPLFYHRFRNIGSYKWVSLRVSFPVVFVSLFITGCSTGAFAVVEFVDFIITAAENVVLPSHITRREAALIYLHFICHHDSDAKVCCPAHGGAMHLSHNARLRPRAVCPSAPTSRSLERSASLQTMKIGTARCRSHLHVGMSTTTRFFIPCPPRLADWLHA